MTGAVCRHLALFLALFFTVTFGGSSAGADSGCIVIKTEAQLRDMAKAVDKCYELGADITLTKAWKPIADARRPHVCEDGHFCGSLDGKNHVINNFYFDTTENDSRNYGLFAQTQGTDKKAVVIKNLTINGKGGTVPRDEETLWVGGIAGQARYTEISNVKVNYTAKQIVAVDKSYNTGNYVYIGGLVGRASMVKLTESSVKADFDVYMESQIYAGGLIGGSNGSLIRSSSYKGNMELKARSDGGSSYGMINAGGIAGYMDDMDGASEVVLSTVEGAIKADSGSATSVKVGGLMGISIATAHSGNSVMMPGHPEIGKKYK